MTRAEIKNLITTASLAEKLKRESINLVIGYLDSRLGDLQVIPCESIENTNNLMEAILCHIDYGDGDLEDLLDDIEGALPK